jgi:hypothetical protein
MKRDKHGRRPSPEPQPDDPTPRSLDDFPTERAELQAWLDGLELEHPSQYLMAEAYVNRKLRELSRTKAKTVVAQVQKEVDKARGK